MTHLGEGRNPQPACLYKQRVKKGADCQHKPRKVLSLEVQDRTGMGRGWVLTPCINQTSCCLLLSSSFKTQQCIFEEYKPEKHQTQEYYVGLNASRTWGPHLLPECQNPGYRSQAYTHRRRSENAFLKELWSALETICWHLDPTVTSFPSGYSVARPTSTQTSLTHNDPTALFFITSQRGTVMEASKNKSQGNRRNKSNVVWRKHVKNKKSNQYLHKNKNTLKLRGKRYHFKKL